MVFNHVAYIAATVYIVEIVGPSKQGILSVKPVSAFLLGSANDRELIIPDSGVTDGAPID